MSRSTSLRAALVALAVACVGAVFLLRGCFGGPRSATVPVAGTIRYRGHPVVDADVAFITPGNARYAIGVTDGRGRFTLGTFTPGDGALVGAHKVTVTTPRGAAAPLTFDGPTTQAEVEAYMKSVKAQEAAADAGRTVVPKRYGHVDTTPLAVTVGPAGGTFDLELVD